MNQAVSSTTAERAGRAAGDSKAGGPTNRDFRAAATAGTGAGAGTGATAGPGSHGRSRKQPAEAGSDSKTREVTTVGGGAVTACEGCKGCEGPATACE
jgi:hypothetical protein